MKYIYFQILNIYNFPMGKPRPVNTGLLQL